MNSWLHRVDRYAVAGNLAGQRFEESRDTGTSGVRQDQICDGLSNRQRCDRHNPAPLAFTHGGYGGFAHGNHRQQTLLQCRQIVVHGERGKVAGFRSTTIGDQHIDVPETITSHFHEHCCSAGR